MHISGPIWTHGDPVQRWLQLMWTHPPHSVYSGARKVRHKLTMHGFLGFLLLSAALRTNFCHD